jgi:uncharacterized protein (UPF0548 family)
MRISISKPGETAIKTFLEKEASASLTYRPEGGTRVSDPVPGYDNDYQRVVVGQGQADFDKAKAALQTWKHFPAAWTAILPEKTPVAEGRVLSMFFRLFGFWWINSCRIVYVVDEPRRYAFAYGTLPGHIESGEEVFCVEMDDAGKVWYVLRAFSRPKVWYVRLGYPFARLLQEKFRQDSAIAVQQYVQGIAAPAFSPNKWFFHLIAFALSGALLWPGSFMGHDYGKLPLLFAFFVMTPLVLLTGAAFVDRRKWTQTQVLGCVFPAAVLAAVSLSLEAGVWAAVLATPWLLVCVATSWSGRRAAWPVLAGCLYLSVGGAWLWADRAGMRPMGFGDDIVRLTALHFHFAGFALPVLTGILLQIRNHWLSRCAALGVVAGVPLTAVGITATQYQFGYWPETLASVVMSLSGLLTGIVLLKLAILWRSYSLALSGATLLFTMILALTYGLRVFWPTLALGLNGMRAVHGSLNGLLALPLAFGALWYYSARAKNIVVTGNSR